MRELTLEEMASVSGGYNEGGGGTTGTRIPGGSYYGNGGTGDPGQIGSVLGDGLPPPPTTDEAPPDDDDYRNEPDPDGPPSMLG